MDKLENDPLDNKIDCHQFYLYIYIYMMTFRDEMYTINIVNYTNGDNKNHMLKKAGMETYSL